MANKSLTTMSWGTPGTTQFDSSNYGVLTQSSSGRMIISYSPATCSYTYTETYRTPYWKSSSSTQTYTTTKSSQSQPSNPSIGSSYTTYSLKSSNDIYYYDYNRISHNLTASWYETNSYEKSGSGLVYGYKNSKSDESYPTSGYSGNTSSYETYDYYGKGCWIRDYKLINGSWFQLGGSSQLVSSSVASSYGTSFPSNGEEGDTVTVADSTSELYWYYVTVHEITLVIESNSTGSSTSFTGETLMPSSGSESGCKLTGRNNSLSGSYYTYTQTNYYKDHTNYTYTVTTYVYTLDDTHTSTTTGTSTTNAVLLVSTNGSSWSEASGSTYLYTATTASYGKQRFKIPTPPVKDINYSGDGKSSTFTKFNTVTFAGSIEISIVSGQGGSATGFLYNPSNASIASGRTWTAEQLSSYEDSCDYWGQSADPGFTKGQLGYIEGTVNGVPSKIFFINSYYTTGASWGWNLTASTLGVDMGMLSQIASTGYTNNQVASTGKFTGLTGDLGGNYVGNSSVKPWNVWLKDSPYIAGSTKWLPMLRGFAPTWGVNSGSANGSYFHAISNSGVGSNQTWYVCRYSDTSSSSVNTSIWFTTNLNDPSSGTHYYASTFGGDVPWVIGMTMVGGGGGSQATKTTASSCRGGGGAGGHASVVLDFFNCKTHHSSKSFPYFTLQIGAGRVGGTGNGGSPTGGGATTVTDGVSSVTCNYGEEGVGDKGGGSGGTVSSSGCGTASSGNLADYGIFLLSSSTGAAGNKASTAFNCGNLAPSSSKTMPSIAVNGTYSDHAGASSIYSVGGSGGYITSGGSKTAPGNGSNGSGGGGADMASYKSFVSTKYHNQDGGSGGSGRAEFFY